MRGIDLSFCRSVPDWEGLRAQGFSFAMIRLAREHKGRSETVLHAGENVRAAAEAGLAVGVSFRLTAEETADARRLAGEFLGQLQPLSDRIGLWVSCELCGDLRRTRKAGEAFLDTAAGAGFSPMLQAAAVHLPPLGWENGYPLYLMYREAGEASALRYAPRLWQYASGRSVGLGAGAALCRGYFGGLG